MMLIADALEQYIEGSRKLIIPKEGHEDALFYSMQRRRIGVQAVQNLVKKYAKEVTPLKKITPHKLRSTYGTALYQETDDIYLVAEVMLIRLENIMRQCLIRDGVRQQGKLY